MNNNNGDPMVSVRGKISDPALLHGFAFMSLEFRHPTGSLDYQSPKIPPDDQQTNGLSPDLSCTKPSTDIATAIQFARYNADRLAIDPNNIFLVGQSRGSLAVLTAAMNDQQVIFPPNVTPDYRGQKSKPQAVFVANAQVTYDHEEVRDGFMKPTASSAETTNIFNKAVQFPLCKKTGLFDYHCHYDKAENIRNDIGTPLSAVSALDANDPPIWVRYDRTPPSTTTVRPLGVYVADAGADQTKTNDEDDCYDLSGRGCLDVHNPNFGVKLRLKYDSLNVSSTSSVFVYAQYAKTSSQTQIDDAHAHFYDNYWCFFIKYKPLNAPAKFNMTDNGNKNRKIAVENFNKHRAPGDIVSSDDCVLTEGEAWQQ